MADVSQIVLKDANGNVIGTYNVKDANVPHDSKTAESGGTTLSLVTTGEKYNWNNSPRMYTNSYPTLFDTEGGNNWIRIGTNNSYGLLPPNSGGVGSGHGYLGTASWYWGNLYVDDVNSPSVMKRNTFVTSSTSYNVDNSRGETRFVYEGHGAPKSGTIASFDSSNNENYTTQLSGGYSTDELYYRTRYGDKQSWNDWIQVTPHKYVYTVSGGTRVNLYVPQGLRNNDPTYGTYLLSLENTYGSGGVYVLFTDYSSTKKMRIVTLAAPTGSVSVAQIADENGFQVVNSITNVPLKVRLTKI